MVKKILLLLMITIVLCWNISTAFAKECFLHKINPAYTQLARERAFILGIPLGEANSTTSCYSYNQLKEALSNKFEYHTENFKIHLEYNFQFSQLNDILADAISEVFTGDDYLANSYVSYTSSWSGFNGNVDITFEFEFLTTYEEEQQITQRIEEIFYGTNGLITDGMNNEIKEKKIHDWIVLNVAYDTTYTEYNAYSALFLGTAVCQGYSLLTHRMLAKVGIEARIVVSTSMNHAWNMVKLCNNWYHLDVTWDDPVPDRPGHVSYNYYNLSDLEMSTDHILPQGYPGAELSYIEGACSSTECLSFADNLNLIIPCAGYNGIQYSFTLNFHPLSDPGGVHPLIWKMDFGTFNTVEECSNGKYLQFSDDLTLTIPCAEYNGIQYRFELKLYHNPKDPGGIYFELDLQITPYAEQS